MKCGYCVTIGFESTLSRELLILEFRLQVLCAADLRNVRLGVLGVDRDVRMLLLGI
jgi:hypothetical protein